MTIRTCKGAPQCRRQTSDARRQQLRRASEARRNPRSEVRCCPSSGWRLASDVWRLYPPRGDEQAELQPDGGARACGVEHVIEDEQDGQPAKRSEGGQAEIAQDRLARFLI